MRVLPFMAKQFFAQTGQTHATPDLSNARVFGARAWALRDESMRGSKLQEVAVEGRWVGFDPVGAGHRVYAEGRYHLARHIKIDESNVMTESTATSDDSAVAEPAGAADVDQLLQQPTQPPVAPPAPAPAAAPARAPEKAPEERLDEDPYPMQTRHVAKRKARDESPSPPVLPRTHATATNGDDEALRDAAARHGRYEPNTRRCRL